MSKSLSQHLQGIYATIPDPIPLNWQTSYRHIQESLTLSQKALMKQGIKEDKSMKWMACTTTLGPCPFPVSVQACLPILFARAVRGQHKAYRSFKTLDWTSGQGWILLSWHLYYLEVVSNLLGLVPHGKIPLLGEKKTLPDYLKGLDSVEFSFSLKLSTWSLFHCNFGLYLLSLYFRSNQIL